MALGEFAAAKACLLQAQERFPLSWVVWKTWGQLYSAESAFQEAIKCFERQLELAPTNRVRLTALLCISDCLQHSSRKDAALATLRQAIDLAPYDGRAYYHVVECQPTLDASDGIAKQLENILQSGLMPLRETQHLHYALGALYDRSDEPAIAFRHFKEANDLRSSEAVFPLTTFRKAVKVRTEVLTRQAISRLSRHGSMDDAFVFIVGMPRSGTTLLDRILNSHSAVFSLGEWPDICDFVGALRWLVHSRHDYPRCISDLSPECVAAYAPLMAQKRHVCAGPCSRVVTKCLDDFWNLGMIAILFPNARIIHCKRHPIDTCLSCFMQNFQEVAFATNLEYLAEVYSKYVRLADHWTSVLPEMRMVDVYYEELVREPERVVRQVCHFCGLSFEEQCLRFNESVTRIDTASRWQVRQPLYGTSVNRWKRYRAFLGPLLKLDSNVGGGESSLLDRDWPRT
jgi:tetratricopeptide (TPR) repeat protein